MSIIIISLNSLLDVHAQQTYTVYNLFFYTYYIVIILIQTAPHITALNIVSVLSYMLKMA